MNELIVLRLKEGQVVGITFRCSERTEALVPRYRNATEEFIRLVEEYPDAYIAWYDQSLDSFLSDTSLWPNLITHPLEVLHLSCFQRCDLMVGSLGFVNFDSPFLLAGPTDRRYPTWLISGVGGIGRSSVFRAVGLDPCLKNFSLALMDFGFRGAELGICPYSEPELLAVQIPEDVL